MEKYSQYRDRGTLPLPHVPFLVYGLTLTARTGSGIAPFFPVSPEASGIALPFHVFLFVCRVPLLAAVSLTYFLLFAWLPVGSLIKKAALWLILGIPGIWWIDLQIDGVKRGCVELHQ